MKYFVLTFVAVLFSLNGFSQALRVDGEPFALCGICIDCPTDNYGNRCSCVVITSNLPMDELGVNGAIIVSHKNDIGRKIIYFLPNRGQKITFYAAQCRPLEVVVPEFVTKGMEYQMHIVKDAPAPFTITSCSVINIDYDGNSLPFDAANTQYLQATINYSCNTSGTYDIYVKFYDVDGKLSTVSDSPTGYSYKESVPMSHGSWSYKMSGWGSKTPGNWRAGSYCFEFFYNGILFYTHHFTVPKGTPPIYTTDSSRLSFSVSGVSFDMIKVAGGTFLMGSNDGDASEKPVHGVTLSDFYIGETEVTCGLWKAVMGSDPSHFKKGDNYPVEEVSWNDCQRFIEKLNRKTGKTFRLPTEAQWEYAARGGKKSNGYKYSGSNNLSQVAWYNYNSSGATHAVKTKSPNELRIYDMSGNVWEWCQDWYGDYPYVAVTNPQGEGAWSGVERVIRGGSSSDTNCRTSSRRSRTPGHRYFYLGLRLALTP